MSKQEPPPKGAYTAVVYCHGMGDQRRYEEPARLIDALDAYTLFDDPATVMGIEAGIEPLLPKGEDVIGYVASRWATEHAEAPNTDWRTIRFYEVYWAPILAGEKSLKRTSLWLLGQVLRPWRTLASPWRERQRLRRATLVRLFADDTAAAAADEDDLIYAYDDYESLDAIRAHPRGSFKGFRAWIAARHSCDPARAAHLQTIADRWWWAYLREELRNLAVLASVVLAALLVASGVLAAIAWLLPQLPWLTAEVEDDTSWLGRTLLAIRGDPVTISSLFLGLVTFSGLAGFVTTYMGDVEAWSAYRETDEKHETRAKILANAVATLVHVLSDKRCVRVVAVGHSLGTAILHDAMLALARLNRAHQPHDPIKGPPDMRKIDMFVTLGSPIDKIEYFFESTTSRSHRFKRVIEDLRGDIGTIPFSRNRKPHIHWVNFWDEADPVSGALQSPSHRLRTEARVENIHVRNWPFPDPAKSHGGYLANRKVQRALVNIIYRGVGSYARLPAEPGQGKDYAAARLDTPPDARGRQAWVVALAFLLPWIAAAGLILGMTGVLAFTYAMTPAALVAAGLASGVLVTRLIR